MDEELTIQPRRGGEVLRRHGTHYQLEAEAHYLVSGPPEPLREISEAASGITERLGEGLLLLSFGNALGYAELPHLGSIEVRSGKWTSEHFDAMLQDLVAIASSLPFAADTNTVIPYDRAAALVEDVVYHAFVYLRHVLAPSAPREVRLVPPLELILREAHRRLERIILDTPVELASHANERTLLGIASGRHPVIPARGAAAHLPLARSLAGHLPMRVDEGEARNTFDTAENRFVKSFLNFVLAVTQRMRDLVKARPSASPFRSRIDAECDWMLRAVAPVRRHSLWDEVGPMIHFPAASTVLHRRRGYREVLHHHVRLRRAARVPLPEETIWALLEAKDSSLLYELWSYFRVVRAVESLLGPPAAAESLRVDPLAKAVPREYRVSWPNGTSVLYNPSFSPRSARDRYSYSVLVRPDIAVEVSGGPNAGLHLLDPKFRLRTIGRVLSEEGQADPEGSSTNEEDRRTFQRADLHKMHAYRDAVPRARSSWVLYPGEEVRFFSSLRGAGPSSGATPPPEVDGVGALPLRPGAASDDDLLPLVARLVAR